MTKQKLLMLIMIAGVSIAVAADQKKNTAEPDLGYNRVVEGAQLYKMYCAACHGIDGRGAGPAAEAMKHPPPDLTAISQRNGGKFPDFRIKNIIDGFEVIDSHGSREMPIWGDFFLDMTRDDELLKLREHNLTEYIRSIQK